MKLVLFSRRKTFQLIIILCGFFCLVFYFHFVNNFDSKPNKSITNYIDVLTCEQSQEWLEINSNIFLKSTSVKYFLDEQKLVALFTCRTGNYNELLNITLNNCGLNYGKQMVQMFNREKTKLDMFFHIRHYQNFLLTSYFDLKIKASDDLILVCGTRKTKVKIRHLHEKNAKKTAVICTEPLFLENQDHQSLAWWIEMNKMSGYQKIILFNNSIPNTREFIRLFDKHKDFVEINQLKCLPNFYNSNLHKYLTDYRELITGKWGLENINFLAFDGIANNECLNANAHENKLVLIQDNDEAFVVPRLEKFHKLTSVVEYMSETKNRYKLNKFLYPTRSDCRYSKPTYFDDLFSQRHGNESDKYSVFFQNVVFVNNDLIKLIFKQISLINFSNEYNFKYPLKIKIKQNYIANDPMYKNPNYGANFVLTITNKNEMNYAWNLLDIYENVVEPFMNETSGGGSDSFVPESFKRFYFFKTPLVQPQYGKSLSNIVSATHTGPHRPNGKIVELNEYYMSHFRTRAIFEKHHVPITSVIFDFNYFYCYFQPIFESFVNKNNYIFK